MAKKRKQRTEKDRKDELARLERMVEGLEKHRHELGDDPKWDRLAKQGRKILDRQRQADRKVEEARKRWVVAKKQLDVAARETQDEPLRDRPCRDRHVVVTPQQDRLPPFGRRRHAPPSSVDPFRRPKPSFRPV